MTEKMATQEDKSRPRKEGKARLTWRGNMSFVVNGLLLACLIHSYWPGLSSCDRLNKEAKDGARAQKLKLDKLVSAVDHSNDMCSRHGEIRSEFGLQGHFCQCHPCFTGKDCSIPDRICIININQ